MGVCPSQPSTARPMSERKLLLLQIDRLRDRIAELESELASCRACREKIDCLSRGEAMQQGDGP
jgi:uncharacterized small protein (DUF1192 family)